MQFSQSDQGPAPRPAQGGPEKRRRAAEDGRQLRANAHVARPDEAEHAGVLRAGADVRARGARWHIVDVRAYNACRVVTLSSVALPCVERRLLDPFDTIEPIDRPPRPQIVSAVRWRAACRALLAADTPPASLRQGRTARIDLMPHQLEPALAVIAGRGTRVLLADEVGLGKTIQAGLILAELRARAWIDRVLVITPAGLRDQWTSELSDRFAIEATGVDGRELRQRSSTLPLGVNPWSALTVAVVSTDYVKRAEVLPVVRSCRWDAVVVDEAHGAAGDSDRRAAVDALASCASYVLLLTATPHSGDRGTFASLCALGSAGNEPLLVFRRRRSDVRAVSRRRVHTLRLQLSAAEHQVHAALARYSDAVLAERGPEACLALSVLHKRAFSSPWSLSQSVARRLATLAPTTAASDAEQMALPLGDPDGERTPADEPPEWPGDLGLRDPVRDRRLLAALLESSRAAIGSDRKVAALSRLLRRANQPAIVFTEYRDTLRHLQRALTGVPIVILHGGMTREERAAALTAFERGTRTVLLATDAAGEGLNLQRACRLVVNLELPWNPMRLEQRIGRVDRIGQARTVHAFHLVADRTGEMRILDRLHARVARAQADIGAPDPVGGRESSCEDLPAFAAVTSEEPEDETRMARLAVTGKWLEEPSGGDPQPANPMHDSVPVAPDFRNEAGAEADRLRRARLLSGNADEVRFPSLDVRGPAIIRASRTGLRSAIGSKALLIWRVSCENRSGVALESQIVAVTVAGLSRQRTPAEMKRTIREVADCVGAVIESCSLDWQEAALRTIGALVDTRLARERAVLATLSARSPMRFQPGLFDSRAERVQRLAARHAAGSAHQIQDRIWWVERVADVSCGPPTLLLAVLP